MKHAWLPVDLATLWSVVSAARQLVMSRGAALIILTVAGSSTSFSIRAGSETPTSPACEADMTQPPSAPLGAAPVVRIWKDNNPQGSAAPPKCTGWQPAQSGTLLAVAGTFRTAEGSAGLISRFGDISGLLSVRHRASAHKIEHGRELQSAERFVKIDETRQYIDSRLRVRVPGMLLSRHSTTAGDGRWHCLKASSAPH